MRWVWVLMFASNDSLHTHHHHQHPPPNERPTNHLSGPGEQLHSEQSPTGPALAWAYRLDRALVAQCCLLLRRQGREALRSVLEGCLFALAFVRVMLIR